ncbi:MAG: hypothetical protein AB8B85_22590 [Paracoccaceae bacterium]
MTLLARYRVWRLLPALALLALQVFMVPLPAKAADKDLRALFVTLGVEQIVICTPEGRTVLSATGEEEGMHCPWCFGFPKMAFPDGYTPILVPDQIVFLADWPSGVAAQTSRTTSNVFLGRAPPAPFI